MKRSSRWSLLLMSLLAWAGPEAARAESAEAAEAVRRLAVLEAELLRREGAAYLAALEAQAEAAEGLASATGDLRLTLGDALRGAASVDELARRQADVVEARASLEEAAVRLLAALETASGRGRTLESHALRLDALVQEARDMARRRAADEPLDGTWDVSVGPMGDTGWFELRQDGTLVRGRYRLASGRQGSLQGTFVDGRLQLEQIDARTGRDAIFFGVWSAADGSLGGTWESRLLGTGRPAHGSWSAARQAEEEPEEVPEAAAPEGAP